MESECVADGRRQPFFMVDNAIVLEYGARIGSNALALYVILACHAKTGSSACYPAIKRLMLLMGRSRPVVFEALRALQEHKLVAVEQRRTETGGLTSNLYTLLPVAAATAAASPQAAPVQMADPLVSDVDRDSNACIRTVGNIASHPGQIDCLPLVNIVYSEPDEVFNETNPNKTNLTEGAQAAPLPRHRGRMALPSAMEIGEFFQAQGSSGGEARKFWNFYESKGWLVGRTPMRDWRAAARNWIGRGREEAGGRTEGSSRLAELSERNEARLEAMRARGALRLRSG